MRKTGNSSIGIVVALLAGALGGALIATAQPAASEAPAQRPPPSREFRAGGPPPEGAGWGMQIGRVLTDEQRTSWREIMQAQREKTRELMDGMREARKALIEASLAEKVDEAAIRKHAEAIGKTEADLAVLRAKALSEIKPPLTPEQREKLKNPPAVGFGRGGPLRGRGGPPPAQSPPE